MKSVEDIFHHYRGISDNDTAAAVLTLAEVASGKQPPRKSERWTVAQAAEFLGCSTGLVYDLAADGRLPCVRMGKGRGTLRFRPEDLEAYQGEASGPPALAPSAAKRKRLLKLD